MTADAMYGHSVGNDIVLGGKAYPSGIERCHSIADMRASKGHA